MKDYDFRKYEKEIRMDSIKDFIRILMYISIMLILGIFCYYISLEMLIFIADKLSLDSRYLEFYSKIRSGFNSDKVLADFSIYLFVGISLISTLFFGLFINLFKINKRFKRAYFELKEQINEMLTLMIFFIGFIPLILKFVLSEGNESLLREIDSFNIVFIMGLVSPYLYSMFSKIYGINETKNVGKSYIKHIEVKFKR